MSTFQQFFPGSPGNVGSSTPINVKVVDFLLVGGGGGAGGNGYVTPYFGGGGGAGEMVEGKNFVVTNGETFTITIGAGGVGGTAGQQLGNGTIISGTPGSNGNESYFGSIAAGGGGGGGGGGPATNDGLPTNGGSGGGRGTTDPPFGNNGESNSKYNLISNVFDKITTITSYTSNSAGISTSLANPGGGAGGNRGQGRSNNINGTSITYAAGGIFPASGDGNTNTGSGGNSSFPSVSGGSGGSGVFILRWPTAYPDASSVTGNVPTPLQPGYYTYRWDGSGSITF
jgi:hypothetical protein